MALRLDVLANTRQFVSEMKKSGASVEDITTALDEMAKDGQRDGEKLEKSFRDIATQAKRADKQVEKVGDTGKAGFGKASSAAGEFKDEALQNFSEIASSFDGSMGSISELAQGTLGGVASALPGIGAAAGIAALGIGAITSELQAAQERAEETKQAIVADFLELGDALDESAVAERVKGILGDKSLLAQAKLLADLLDITVGEAALAMAGDFDSAGTSIEDVRKAIENAPSSVDSKNWQDLKDTIQFTEDGFKAGREAADAFKDAQGKAADSAKSKQDKLNDSVKNTAKYLRDYPKDVTVRVNVDESAIYAAQRRAEAWARNGLNVAVTGTLTGRTWE